MSNKEADFTLLAWVKRDQLERAEHQAKQVVKSANDDELFTRMLQTLVKLGLKPKDQVFALNLVRHKSEGKNYTPAQRSAITSLFYKYVA